MWAFINGKATFLGAPEPNDNKGITVINNDPARKSIENE